MKFVFGNNSGASTELPAITLTIIDILVFFQSGSIGIFRNNGQVELGRWYTSEVAAKKWIVVSKVKYIIKLTVATVILQCLNMPLQVIYGAVFISSILFQGLSPSRGNIYIPRPKPFLCMLVIERNK